MKKIAVILLAVLIAFSGCAQESKISGEKYTSQKIGVKIDKPSGWSVTECRDNCKKDEPAISVSGVNGSRINVFVNDGVDEPLENIVEEFKRNSASINGIKFEVKSENPVSISGQAGKSVLLEASVGSGDNITKVSQEFAVFKNGSKFFVISATYKSGDIKKQQEEFNKFLAGFEIR